MKMNHYGTERIETNRLTLRRFTEEDAQAMYKNWASDPEVTRFLTWPTHSSSDITKAILREWEKSYEDSRTYQWAIVLNEINEPIGSISAVALNDDISMVEVGYCIGKNWWNQGITSEALLAVVDFFFEKVNANRIQAKHDPNNPNSGKVMKKCQMKYEGTLRRSDRSNQGIVDYCIYSILKSEWPDSRNLSDRNNFCQEDSKTSF